MGTKSLTITEEAYKNLKSHKRDDESFTDTINRLTGGERDIMNGFGAFAGADGFREAVDEARGDINEGFDERQERLQNRR